MSAIDEMPEDLRWLAENVNRWLKGYEWACVYRNYAGGNAGMYWSNFIEDDHKVNQFNHEQWQAARQQLADERMNNIARNGNDGLHYDPIMTEEEETEYAPAEKRSKYHVEIRPGAWVDVYDVLTAYRVTNPADAHAIKKMLCPGKRGVKSANQDRREAIISLGRAIELEGDE